MFKQLKWNPRSQQLQNVKSPSFPALPHIYNDYPCSKLLLYKPVLCVGVAHFLSEIEGRNPLLHFEVASACETLPTEDQILFGFVLPLRPHRYDIAAPRTSPSARRSTRIPSRL